jgi:A/G-specific adenine glycosylase
MHPIARSLLAWYRTHARDLPWRRTRDPYAIFISELMLQQTQVDRVVPKYRDWLRTFSTWRSLARASTHDVVRAWAGLGYNRRALYAREAARQVVVGGLPTDLDGWRKLKGVGPYMAAALTEFVTHRRAVVIDTNIRRVAGRLLLGLPFPSPADDRRLLPALDALTPARAGHDLLPQAFLDFANAVCLVRSPACVTCPLKKSCEAAWYFLEGGKRPKMAVRKPTERIRDGKKFPDRIYRGRILKLVLAEGRIRVAKIGPLIDDTYVDTDADWVRSMAGRLVADGLLSWKGTDVLVPPKG